MKRLKRAAITIELVAAIAELPTLTIFHSRDGVDDPPVVMVNIERVKEKIRERMRELDSKGWLDAKGRL